MSDIDVQLEELAAKAHAASPQEASFLFEEQPGLTVTSEAKADHGPGSGRSFVLSFVKGATIDLPDRLAKKQIDLGFATAATGFKMRGGGD